MSLIEIVAGIGIFTATAVAALGAMLAGAHVVSEPATRDVALTAARNAVVEARAVSAYDAGAVAAILAASPATWNNGGVTLQSSIDAKTLVVVASAGTANGGTDTVSVRYAVAQEALPQGTIVDESGNTVTP